MSDNIKNNSSGEKASKSIKRPAKTNIVKPKASVKKNISTKLIPVYAFDIIIDNDSPMQACDIDEIFSKLKKTKITKMRNLRRYQFYSIQAKEDFFQKLSGCIFNIIIINTLSEYCIKNDMGTSIVPNLVDIFYQEFNGRVSELFYLTQINLGFYAKDNSSINLTDYCRFNMSAAKKEISDIIKQNNFKDLADMLNDSSNEDNDSRILNMAAAVSSILDDEEAGREQFYIYCEDNIIYIRDEHGIFYSSESFPKELAEAYSIDSMSPAHYIFFMILVFSPKVVTVNSNVGDDVMEDLGGMYERNIEAFPNTELYFAEQGDEP